MVPERVRELEVEGSGLGRAWLPRDLPEIVESLAGERQVVTSFIYWTAWEDTHTFLETPTWELDWSLPWEQLVASARESALVAAHRASPPAETVVVVSWLDESDR